ncbi:hypothetical protein K2173_014500 [Erythroxylum novogranatense]|uniref:Reverse transcriptase domain-containing protein n=1 Tax=Erythroxylum novogranatense TaxID=1862640 RepID=A0AAV8S6P7_9ROSI|nr:hypothetical protein K2173_014500 [Erythroxylum novogranatense]
MAANSQQFGFRQEPSRRVNENQVGQLATSLSKLESQGKLPSQTIVNPKENISAITLRNGKDYPPNAKIKVCSLFLALLGIKRGNNSTGDGSIVYPKGVLEDVLVQVNGLIFPADFFILDMEGDKSSNSSDILLGRPFLSTARTKIDVHNGTLTMEFDGEVITFNVYDAMKYPNDVSCVSSIDIVEPLIQTAFEMEAADKLMVALCKSLTPDNIDDVNQETSHNELHEVVYLIGII